MTKNQRIVLNIAASYGRSLYGLFCGLFVSRWVLASLGKVDFGLYGLIAGLVAFVSIFNSLLGQATGRFYAFSVGAAKQGGEAGLEECRRWFNVALFVHTVVPVVLIAVGYPLGMYAVKHWLTIPPERLGACIWVFRFVCVSCFVGMVNVPFSAMYTAKQYIAELTIYGVVSTTAIFCLCRYMVTHPGEWLAKYALAMCLIGILPQLIISIRALKVFPECKIKPSYMCSLSRVKKLGNFAFWQAFGGLGATLRGQGIQILINKFFGPAMNTSMAIGNQLAAQSQTLAGAMQGAFAPAITTACGAGDYVAMRALAYRACKFGMSLALVFVLPLSLELPAVMKLWLGNPPAYAVELCWCVLAMMIIDKSASGHMLAVAAKGKIAAYQAFLGGSIIMTLPLAWLLVAKGFGVCSVGWAMIATIIVCAWGRVWFARRLVGMSARHWLFKIMAPVCCTIAVCGTLGFMVRFCMQSGFARICLTTAVCEFVFLPMVWFFVLDASERAVIARKAKQRFSFAFA